MVKTNKDILNELQAPSFVNKLQTDYNDFMDEADEHSPKPVRFRVYDDNEIVSYLRYVKDTPLVDLYPVTTPKGQECALLGVYGSTHRISLDDIRSEEFDIERLSSWIEIFYEREEILVWVYETLTFLLTKDLPVGFAQTDKEMLLLTFHDWLLLTTHAPKDPNSPLLIDPTMDMDKLEEYGLLMTDSPEHLYEKVN